MKTLQITANRLEKSDLSCFISRNEHKDKSITRFGVENAVDAEILQACGFVGFNDFWQLPGEFVDEVNYRRGGWSAVSRLSLQLDGVHYEYFVKRQENQIRYSVSKPFGRLTFEYELAGIRQNIASDLPAINVVVSGFRQEAGNHKGLLVTRATKNLSLHDLIATGPDWQQFESMLTNCGRQLLAMHLCGIQHGALYPKHLFIDTNTGDVQLIDFERSRKRRFSYQAATADLTQLIRRLDEMPRAAIETLLQPYFSKYGRLLEKLLSANKNIQE